MIRQLPPSTRIGEIPLEELHEHPLGGIYVLGRACQHLPSGAAVRLERFGVTPAGDCLVLSYWLERPDGFLPVSDPITAPLDTPLYYARLPALSFAMTVERMRTSGDQPSGRQKSVTRRAMVPRWFKPGKLFNAWSGSFRHGRTDYLGTFAMVSAERVGRWRCTGCDPVREFTPEPRPLVKGGDLLNPDELSLEGFPDIDPGEFWKMLVKSGNVGPDGRVCRIEFEAIP